MLSTYDHETSYTCSPWVKDVPYWFWGQKVKGQGHGLSMFENGFRTITDSVINQWSWNFIHLLTMSQGCGQKVKGQGHGAWLLVPPQVKPEWTIGLHSVCLSVSLSVRHTSFRTITDSVIHLWSWNFIHLLPMSQGCALLILGSKGQRSRSWRMVIWKWFPDDMVIMKLHTLTHHESRMCPIDFEVKRSKVKVMAHGYLKMVSGR